SVKRFPEESMTAHGSMNHVAFNVDEAQLEDYLARLKAAGVPATPVVVNHDDSPMGVARENHPGVFVRSVYFTDPTGIMMEFAAFTRPMTPADVRHAPATAKSAALTGA
ncbi:MAG: VOC family protein, partial [Caulobacteraceae bacterium]